MTDPTHSFSKTEINLANLFLKLESSYKHFVSKNFLGHRQSWKEFFKC